jgi:cytochrome c oxidase assembly protein subunit 11
LLPGEAKSWPVVFYIDPKLPKDVRTITLSYTFFEVGGKTPAAPTQPLSVPVVSSMSVHGPLNATPAVAQERRL